MTILEIAPWIGAAGFLTFTLWQLSGREALKKNTWLLPAGLSALFLIWTLIAVFIEGPLSFWAAHMSDFWGNQIWFDLLFAISISWFFILPQARKQGMKPAPWLGLIICTGCIGVLAMVSRLLYLKENHQGT